MPYSFPQKYLSFTDRTAEVAFAVYMVIIINGYVALSDLNTGYWYIVAVNLGACLGWGIIDGMLYFTSSSINRNNTRKKLILFKSAKNDEASRKKLKSEFDDTFLENFDDESKEKIAGEMLQRSSQASPGPDKLITKVEAIGWLSIILIYVIAGLLLALPFLIIPDKFVAWIVSNLIGCAWLFYYGTKIGESLGKHRVLLGLITAGLGVVFLLTSYVVWVLVPMWFGL
jgi:hypothetical protein